MRLQSYFNWVDIDPDKIRLIEEWPTPPSVKELSSFLELTFYYYRFVKGYALIASLLADLLCKDTFAWTQL